MSSKKEVESYAEYYIATSCPKLKKKVNIKELIYQEYEERNLEL
jgi:hypothetical protein